MNTSTHGSKKPSQSSAVLSARRHSSDTTNTGVASSQRNGVSRPATDLMRLGTVVCLLLLVSLHLTGCGGELPKVSFSSGAFDFGTVAVGTQINRAVVTITNSGTSSVTLSPSLVGNFQGSLTTAGSCRSTLPASSSCSLVVSLSPTSAGAQAAQLNLNMTGQQLPQHQTVTLTATAVALAPGDSAVSSTNNPLVAMYSYAPTSGAQVSVEFGPDTNYGLQTSAQSVVPEAVANIYVAGMQADTTYHMRARALLSDGSTVTDNDHSFTTSHFDPTILPKISATTSGTPQPGVELIDVASSTSKGRFLEAYATDLSGNIIWGYDFPDHGTYSAVQPIKLLPNGNFLVTVSFGSQLLVNGVPPGALVDLREIDLAGDPIRDITLDQLNSRLAAAGYNLVLNDIHHDVTVLPNGHWVLIASSTKPFSNLTGMAGTTNVIGDVIVDLDTNLNPVWVWNSFDHLDVNRHPIGFPDWTHTNAVLYSSDDGNLLVSMRHQSWILKLNYLNGTGNGSILWHLGREGDFTLTNGSAPADWFYGQHQPSFVSTANAGVFSLALMDNGYGRFLDSATQCTTVTTSAACYTTVPILSIDESAKTATVLFRDTLPASQYSYFGGGSTALANGNLEFDLCAQDLTNSQVNEITSGASPQTVWQLTATGTNMYRANRLPSLYPGVQW